MERLQDLLKQAPFDYAALAYLDFIKESASEYHFFKGDQTDDPVYFDLASLTKPIVLGTTFLEHEELFKKDIILLSEHRAGLKSWGLLLKNNWQEIIMSYDIKESLTRYSDYSPLRCQLELEKQLGHSLKEIVDKYSNDELLYHTELNGQKCVPTGFSKGEIICGSVHDPNASNLGCFLAHAGYFSTLKGLCDFLFTVNRESDLIKKYLNIFDKKVDRFIRSWDTPSRETSLAGPMWGEKTIGHLGFTGTSMWIDLEKSRGIVLLTNATQYYWHERNVLNDLRRLAGTEVLRMP